MSMRILLGFVLSALLVNTELAPAACPGESFLGAKDGARSANVKVTVVVILAKKEGKRIDKRLKQIAEEIQKFHPELTSFELKSLTDRSVKPGMKEVFNLVDKKQAQVVIRHGADESNKVGLTVSAPGIVGEIVYSTVCGKFLPIVTRYETAKGQWLILAIQVQPCKGE